MFEDVKPEDLIEGERYLCYMKSLNGPLDLIYVGRNLLHSPAHLSWDGKSYLFNVKQFFRIAKG